MKKSKTQAQIEANLLERLDFEQTMKFHEWIVNGINSRRAPDQ